MRKYWVLGVASSVAATDVDYFISEGGGGGEAVADYVACFLKNVYVLQSA